MPIYVLTGVFVFLVVAAYSLSRWVVYYAHKFNHLDPVNSRSSHKNPTPRLGGLSFAFIIPLIFVVETPSFNLSNKIALVCTLPPMINALVSMMDDLKGGISRLQRIIWHSLSAISAYLLFLYGGEFHLNCLWALVFMLVMVWFINLYNFMDGIDGIAVSQAIFLLASSCLFCFWRGNTQWAELQLFLTAPLIGFAIINWQPARLFMGDIGSTFLGALVFVIYTLNVQEGLFSLYSAMILTSAFWVDTSWTLAVRMMTRQRWTDAHRSHLYQILSLRLNSHEKVTLIYTCLNLFWLLPLSFLVVQWPSLGFLFLILAIIPQLALCWRFKAGFLNSTFG